MFRSHRESDYTRVSNHKKEWRFTILRGNLISQAIDRANWYLAPRYFYTVDFPTHVDIESSVSCQMRCPMCLRNRMDKSLKIGVMNLELYKKIIDECSRRGVYSVKLSWRGEPLSNPHVVDMVKYAKDRRIKDVAFLTNGERLNPDLTVQLIEAGLDWISISIDGLGETYERIRWPSTFDGIVSKVKFLKESRDSRGLKKPLIRVQTIWGAVKDNVEQYFELWETLADKVYIIGDQSRGNLNIPFPRDPKYMCCEPWRRLTVGWNGLISQCIGDYEELSKLGDVRTQSLYEIWHGEKFNKLRGSIRSRKLFTNEPCQRCHDPGLMYPKKVSVNSREITIGLYKGQELDIDKMDARG